MPTAATGRPTPVISNTPSGSPPCATSRSDTTRLVDVPITVTTPPNTAAYDSGMRYGDGDTFGTAAPRDDSRCGERHQRRVRQHRRQRAGGDRQPGETAHGCAVDRPRRRRASVRRALEHTIDHRRQRPGHRRCTGEHVERGDRDRRGRRQARQRLFLIDHVGEQEHADRGPHRCRCRQPVEREHAEGGDQHDQRDPGVGRHRRIATPVAPSRIRLAGGGR